MGMKDEESLIIFGNSYFTMQRNWREKIENYSTTDENLTIPLFLKPHRTSLSVYITLDCFSKSTTSIFLSKTQYRIWADTDLCSTSFFSSILFNTCHLHTDSETKEFTPAKWALARKQRSTVLAVSIKGLRQSLKGQLNLDASKH